MRILLVSAWFPDPPNNGSKQRIYNLIRRLGPHHELHLFSFDDPLRRAGIPDALRSLCAKIEVVARKEPTPAYNGFLRSTPRSLVATFSSDMAHRIAEASARARFDVVLASQLAAAAYAPFWNGWPAVFDEVELGVLYERFVRADSVARRLRHWLTWTKLRRYLQRLLRRFSACTVVSESERRLLSAAAPGFAPIEVVPNSVHLPDYESVREPPQPGTLIFCGSFSYAPNLDAMLWFVREVLPLVRVKFPSVHLTITGDPAGHTLSSLEGVTQTGLVADVSPLIAASWISLAPIREGGGTRVKILEAMALGTPVVATTKGAEGLAVVDGTHLLIADEPHLFAERISQLVSDSNLRSRVAASARQLVSERYDWRIVGDRLEALLERVAGGERRLA